MFGSRRAGIAPASNISSIQRGSSRARTGTEGHGVPGGVVPAGSAAVEGVLDGFELVPGNETGGVMRVPLL